eukprot:NODE_128_length_17019_cov_0.764480.p16 type:complete len:105 gc:universal NODE_128_length_17019_cov_0.764480:16251-16565(+)
MFYLLLSRMTTSWLSRIPFNFNSKMFKFILDFYMDSESQLHYAHGTINFQHNHHFANPLNPPKFFRARNWATTYPVVDSFVFLILYFDFQQFLLSCSFSSNRFS